MSQIINIDGEDKEVFTAEELETQKTAALEDFKKSNPDKSEELTKLQADLKTKEEELTKLKGKDMNFSNLRDQKDAAEKAKEELLKQIDEKIGSAKKEVLDGVLKDHYGETLKALTGDEELKKKIEYHYNRLTDPSSTKEEVAKKLRDAWVLATSPENPGALNSTVLSSGGVSRFPVQSGDKKFSLEEQALGQKFGLSGDDFKKYSNQ